ncbi:hypothetical protein [Streptomyces sp. SID13031]|uniref:hypothetical protein n=1 Tax=Streptomyces sp. SID13031 TaxID=2706046 RepID=UPI0013CA6C79|nr:hypothetical protein [Streptomyces sp. SID13031]NEA33402.1 hypothetical protein [Streptomyces sp. SID13031]
MPDPVSTASWTTVVTVAFGSSVLGTTVGKLLDRTGSRTETIRAGYADATKALNAWGQFPYRIRRRVDDTAETLVRLEALGAEIQEALAYATGWVSAESSELGEIYNRLVELLRAEVTLHAREAWASPPAGVASAMNISGNPHDGGKAVRTTGVIPAEWVVVQLFSTTIQYRIGWRRYLWIRPLLRRRLARRRITAQAEAAFGERSGRLLALQLSESKTP